jgi:hypothetical protein
VQHKVLEAVKGHVHQTHNTDEWIWLNQISTYALSGLEWDVWMLQGVSYRYKHSLDLSFVNQELGSNSQFYIHKWTSPYYILNKQTMYLTKYLRLNVSERRFIRKIHENKVLQTLTLMR